MRRILGIATLALTVAILLLVLSTLGWLTDHTITLTVTRRG